MPRQIFYIHNHKCGGTSIKKSLNSSRINHISCRDIDLESNSDAYNLLIKRKNYDWILFGHPGSWRRCKDDNKLQEFYEIIYNKAQIIFPSRHPVYLLRSFMHYYKTRVNELIRYRSVNSRSYMKILESDKKLVFMIQAILFITEEEKLSFEECYLDSNKESFYLSRFLKFIQKNSESLIPAWTQTRNLLFPQKEEIIKLIKSKTEFSMSLAEEIDSERLFIYDSQKYSNYTRERLADYFGASFMNSLASLQENKSQSKESIELNLLSSFDQEYRDFFKCEYDIFDYAK